jgi:hypothetical protein
MARGTGARRAGFALLAAVLAASPVSAEPLAQGTGSATKKARSDRPVVGWIEHATIEPGHLRIRAKLDTGARTSSLNAPNYKVFDRDGEPWVKFSVTNREGQTVEFERQVVRSARIKRIMGPSQIRPVVILGICLAGLYGETEVNLVNRDGFNYQMLIGRRFLSRRVAVDPARTLTSRRACKTQQPNGKGG